MFLVNVNTSVIADIHRFMFIHLFLKLVKQKQSRQIVFFAIIHALRVQFMFRYRTQIKNVSNIATSAAEPKLQ
jgi:hypothetical protein